MLKSISELLSVFNSSDFYKRFSQEIVVVKEVLVKLYRRRYSPSCRRSAMSTHSTPISWMLRKSLVESKMTQEVPIKTPSSRNVKSWTTSLRLSSSLSEMLSLHSRVSWQWLRTWRHWWTPSTSTLFQPPGPNMLSQVIEALAHGSITWSIDLISSTSGKTTRKTFHL